MFEGKVSPVKPVEFLRCSNHAVLQADGMALLAEQDNDQGQHEPAWEEDRALEENIKKAVWKNDVLRATDINEIDIQVRNGIVYLSGHLTSSINRDRVTKALQSVDGIESVIDALVLDDDLLRDVAGALSGLEKSDHCKFFTGVSHGVIVLNGEVDNTELRRRAEAIAASQPGVRGVINYLRVEGVILAAEDRRFLQPVIGEEICFLDGVSGFVRQVVINPENRRVMAMTIQGHFIVPLQSQNDSNFISAQPPEQLLLIPMNIVGVLTDSSGFLTTASTDYTATRLFDAAEFMVPERVTTLDEESHDWNPPYPYCLADVLFPRDPAMFATRELTEKE